LLTIIDELYGSNYDRIDDGLRGDFAVTTTTLAGASGMSDLGDYENRRAMALMTLLFFMCGFLATLNDVLIPHLKSIFELNYVRVMLVQFSFFSSFLLFSVPAGMLVERIGYQKTLFIGLFMMSGGALLFIPAARVPSFGLFMGALVILAGGVTFLQVSGNPYVSALGLARTASSRLNLTQAFNSLGSTIAPYFGGALILGAAAPISSDLARKMSAAAMRSYRVQQASSVELPYVGIALTLFVLGCAIAVVKLPQIWHPQSQTSAKSTWDKVWKHRHMTLAAVGIFVYCGAEITIGGFLVSYLTQTDIGDMTRKAAAGYVSIYWGGSMLGRFAGSALLRKIMTGTLVGTNALFALALVSCSILSHGSFAVWTILLVGLFNSILFPSLFTLGIAELGELTGKASGILMAAAVGAAIIPVVQGAMADKIGVHHSFVVPALCYVFVALYGFKWCKPSPVVRTQSPAVSF
jgi:FHS family L-fucose permease-like MFS transporter